MSKTAIIYVRVSTEEQKKKGYSISGQTQRCIEFAKRNDYSVIKIFTDEGKSAKNLKRPELQEMFRYIKCNSRKPQALIFWKWDRLSRGEDADYVELGKLFDRYNITPLSVEENNETSPEAKLMRKITRATSAYELDKDSQRTKMGMLRKAEEGFFPGKAPIGYLNVRDEHDKGIIVEDIKTSPYIISIFQHYASENGHSLEALGQIMFKEGFKDKYGNPYKARKFEEILKNPFYTGDFIWAGKRYQGKHKPIIDKKLFYRVQERFGNTNKPKYNDKNFTYTNFITCAKCGCYMTAERKNGAHNSGNYIYYHCTNRKKMHSSLKGLSVREEVIDTAFQDIISSIAIPTYIVTSLKDKIISSLDKLYEAENKLIESKMKRIKELDHLIARSYEDKLLGKLPPSYTEELFNKQSSDWQKERDILAIDIKESNNINSSVYKNIDLIINFCNKMPDLYINASIEDKRCIMRMLIEDIQYADGELVVKLKPIFEAMRLLKETENITEHSNVRTLKKPLNKELLEYLNEQVSSVINAKVRTLETRIIPNKKDPEGANLLNGADSGIRTHVYRNHNPRS